MESQGKHQEKNIIETTFESSWLWINTEMERKAVEEQQSFAELQLWTELCCLEMGHRMGTPLLLTPYGALLFSVLLSQFYEQ